MLSLIGKTIVAVKGFCTDRRRKKGLHPRYIMFDDGETYIELEDQDYYSYHDCDGTAKNITVHHNKRRWKFMVENENGYYPDANKNYVW